MKTCVDRYGYLQAHICVHGKERAVTVHRMVAEAWIPNPSLLPQVNHIDGNKLNNHADNLEWCDAGHNLRHARALGLVDHAKGERAGGAKLTSEQVLLIRSANEKGRALAKRFGVSESLISMIKSRKIWTHI